LPERFDVALLDFVGLRDGLEKELLLLMSENTTVKIDVFIDYT
jgi:hypothetical protein